MKDTPSRQVLDEAPARAFELLMGIGKSLTARAALFAKGFSQAEHEYAWTRLLRLGAFVKQGSDLDKEVRGAVSELDAWDDRNFDPIENTLARAFEPQAAFLFDNLGAGEGDESVIAVEKLLDRIAALASAPERAATRAQDQAALDLLTSRGYTPAEWDRLRTLVGRAKTVQKVAPVSEAERDQLLIELYRWHREWASHARNSIKKRATLITLGLARRQKRKADDIEEGDGDQAPAPAPATVTATSLSQPK